MAATYGPLALTANTITSVGIPATSDRVYIGNDSPYDLLVSFAVSQPANVTTSQGDWPYVVQAMHHAVLDIPDNYRQPTALGLGGFLGRVWVLPIPRNSLQALNGTISGTANLWVTALDLGDASPDAYAAPRQTDLSSQARVIVVPAVAQINDSEQTAVITPGNTVLLSQSVALTIAQGQSITAYLHHVLANHTGAATWSFWTLSAIIVNGVGVAQSSPVELVRFTSTLVGSGNPPMAFMPPVPPAAVIQNTSTQRVALALQAKLISNQGTVQAALSITAGFTVDQTNNGLGVPSIGNALPQFPTPGGAPSLF